MRFPDLSPNSIEILTKYANRPEFGGDVKKALENLIYDHARPHYQIVADEYNALRLKRLEREEHEFNKAHWNGKEENNRKGI